MSDSDIMAYLKEMEKDSKQIKHDVFRLCWYMRGGLTYFEAMTIAPDDKKILGDIIKDNLETTKKTGQPFF